MLKQIDWAIYFGMLALLTGAYYFVIYCVYFRNKRSSYFQQNAHSAISEISDQTDSPSYGSRPLTEYDGSNRQDPTAIANPPNAPSEVVHFMINELKALVLQSAAQDVDKETLLHNLCKLLRNYPSLKGSSFQQAITSLVESEVEVNCEYHFTEAELTRLWL